MARSTMTISNFATRNVNLWPESAFLPHKASGFRKINSKPGSHEELTDGVKNQPHTWGRDKKNPFLKQTSRDG